MAAHQCMAEQLVCGLRTRPLCNRAARPANFPSPAKEPLGAVPPYGEQCLGRHDDVAAIAKIVNDGIADAMSIAQGPDVSLLKK